MNGINQMHEENKVVAAAASNDDDDNMHLNLPHHYLAEADFEVYADLPVPTKNVVSDGAWTKHTLFKFSFHFWSDHGPLLAQISIFTLACYPELFEPILLLIAIYCGDYYKHLNKQSIKFNLILNLKQ